MEGHQWHQYNPGIFNVGRINKYVARATNTDRCHRIGNISFYYFLILTFLKVPIGSKAAIRNINILYNYPLLTFNNNNIGYIKLNIKQLLFNPSNLAWFEEQILGGGSKSKWVIYLIFH